MEEVVEAKSSSGYGKPPWVFRGSALYQLHLVKAEKARACIPKEFKLVEAFGYTLGGFFLASYEDSPVGVFDEDLSGTAPHPARQWNASNRPKLVISMQESTAVHGSILWATRVYVNNDGACYHGRKEVGLPSKVARFSKTVTAISRKPRGKSGFLNMIGVGDEFYRHKELQKNVQATEIKCLDTSDNCNISLTSAVPSLRFDRWMGPTIRMSLPSFSGGTDYHPNLLKYSCNIECRVQAVQPLKVSRGSFPLANDDDTEKQCLENYTRHTHVTKDHKYDGHDFSTCVMLSKPILALKFNQMKMQVEAPLVLYQSSNCLETTISSVP